MARKREFNESEVLEKAMQVFWSRGYEATSMIDLTSAMGISKSSLYDTFGDKHALFLSTIDYYRANVSSQIRSVIDLELPAKQIITGVVNRAVDRILDPAGNRGCLLNNTAVERGPRDPEAALRCAAGLTAVEETFYLLLQRAVSEGDLGPERDIRAMARYFTGIVNGILVIGKANPDRSVLEDIATTAMSVLD